MELKDPVYGTLNIREPLLLDLLYSRPFQRLEKLNQYGLPKPYYHKVGFSRKEHSIGVMLLLRKLGASIEEQAAGLLHDISHTAFGHIIDFVFTENQANYQDLIHQDILQQSEIAEILKEHGFKTVQISEIRNFTLLEQPSPALCADRIDYTLREVYHDLAEQKAAQELGTKLQAVGGKIVFTDKKSAEQFSNYYLKCQTEHRGGRQSMIRYHLASQMITQALKQGTIQKRDLFKNEEYVLNKIDKSQDLESKRYLALLLQKEFTQDEKKPTILVKKFGYVDPEYLEGNVVKKLSQTTPEFKQLLEEHKIINKKGMNINILDNS